MGHQICAEGNQEQGRSRLRKGHSKTHCACVVFANGRCSDEILISPESCRPDVGPLPWQPWIPAPHHRDLHATPTFTNATHTPHKHHVNVSARETAEMWKCAFMYLHDWYQTHTVSKHYKECNRSHLKG